MGKRVNQQWCLKARPQGQIEESHFEWRRAPIPELRKGGLLVRTIYLSLDPTNRIWMSDIDQYMAPVQVGEVMRGGTIGVVEESNDPKVAVGDLVQGVWGWQEFAVISAGSVRNTLPKNDSFPLTAYMGLLGSIGATAYFGLLDVGKPLKGETLVVTGAAGAVGSIAGQIGKIKGCRVVGIAGSSEKCRWITDELKFDASVNYKTENVLEALKEQCPNGIDVDFENVGGTIFDDILTLINRNARIALCGLISQYTHIDDQKPFPGPVMFRNVLMKRARIEGFIVTDFLSRFPEAFSALRKWHAAGLLKYRVDVVQGLENAATAVNKLFDGSNQGKLIVQVSDDPTSEMLA
ncbi:MAG: NADP-dependent oxidoreductase [SAR324 cluster bacterium]|nr:NADP-dependent oxidoreductase [SAR324 cluster bacterium]